MDVEYSFISSPMACLIFRKTI